MNRPSLIKPILSLPAGGSVCGHAGVRRPAGAFFNDSPKQPARTGRCSMAVSPLPPRCPGAGYFLKCETGNLKFEGVGHE